MRTGNKKLISVLLSAAIMIPMLGSVMPQMMVNANGNTIYEFNAADYELNDAPAASRAMISGNNLWSVKVVSNTANTMDEKAIGFSMKTGTQAIVPVGEIMKHTFADDTVSPPSEELNDGVYILEHVFTPTLGSGWLDVCTNGDNGVISRLRIDGVSGKGSSSKAYMADESGNAIGDGVVNFKLVGTADSTPGSILYLKEEIDVAGGTYSAWLKPVKTAADGGSIDNTSVSDDDVLVKEQPFNTKSSKLSGISYDMQNTGKYAHGVWFNRTTILKGDDGGSDVDNTSDEKVFGRALAYMQNYKLTNEPYSDIKSDLNLIDSWTDDVSGKSVSVTWKSSDTAAISDDGKYMAGERPAADITVVMTATVEIGEYTDTVEYTLKINKFSNEKLIISAELNNPASWKLYDKGSATEKFDNLTAEADGSSYVITKKSVDGETDYSDRYMYMYAFNRYFEKYSDETRTATYEQGLNGRYKIVSNVKHHISSGSQFQNDNIAMGSTIDKAKFPFIMAINSSKVYNYSDQSNPVYTGNIVDKDAEFVYTIDTKTGDYTAQVNGGNVYSTTVTPATVWGMMYTIKSKAYAGDWIKVNSIKVYSLDDETVSNPLSQTASKLTMNDITDNPESVTGDVSLPTEIDGAAITWTTSNSKYITSGGVLTERPLESDADVILTAKISNGENVIYKDFYLTVSKENDPSVITDKDMQLVTISALTSQNPEEISSDLNLPKSGKYGSEITWSSSDPEFITDDGKVLKLADNLGKKITMTATFSYGGLSRTKAFEFGLVLDFESGLFTLYELKSTGNSLTDNITATNGGGKISVSDGVVVLDRTSRTGDASTGITFKPTLENREIALTRECVLQTDVTIPDANTKFEIIPRDSNGNRITTIYSGNESGTKPYFVYVVADDSGSATHNKVYYTVTGNSTNLKFKMNIKPDSGSVAISYSQDGGAWKALEYNGKTDMNVREAATSLASVDINAPDNSNDKITNSGYVKINNASVLTNKSLVLQMALDKVSYKAPFTATNGYIMDSVNLNVGSFPGTTASWTSSKPEILSNDGKLDKSLISDNTTVDMTFKLVLNSDENVSYTEVVPVTIIYTSPFNLSLGKNAESNAVSNRNHETSKAVDGLSETSWQTMRLDENPYLTVDLGDVEAFTAININEASVQGNYPVKGYKIEVSSDKSKWTAVYEGGSLGAETQNIRFSPVCARYVKYTVTDKSSGNSGLSEISVYVGTDDKGIAEAENKLITNALGSLRGIKSNVSMPKTKYGATVTYESTIPSNFSNNGTVVRDASKNVTGILKVTTTYKSATVTNEVPIMVSAGSSSSSGGGGGTPVYGSGSSSSKGSNVPAMPSGDNQSAANISGKLFADVTEDLWAYSYIKTLKDAGVVSGDEKNCFNPEENVSRQEFVKMLLTALKIDIGSNAELNFADVSESDWSYAYIRKAVELGIVRGISETEFDKTSSITRQDMAVMCVRAMKAAGSKIIYSSAGSFSDSEQIAEYAEGSVGAMLEKKILSGYDDNTFKPNKNALRSEAAKIICGIISNR